MQLHIQGRRFCDVYLHLFNNSGFEIFSRRLYLVDIWRKQADQVFTVILCDCGTLLPCSPARESDCDAWNQPAARIRYAPVQSTGLRGLPKAGCFEKKNQHQKDRRHHRLEC